LTKKLTPAEIAMDQNRHSEGNAALTVTPQTYVGEDTFRAKASAIEAPRRLTMQTCYAPRHTAIMPE
jgi:hypothetical protein